MATKINFIPSGGITSPQGFRAGATSAGIKKVKGSLDLTILFSEAPCVAAGVFTTNRIKAAPVLLSQKRLLSGRAAAVVVNAGCANACTGEQGLSDAEETAELVAQSIGISAEDVLVASTGVIGEKLPMKKLREGIRKIALSRDGGHELAQAIMTTDTKPKEVAVEVKIDGTRFMIGGVAKGAGMIHPNLATLLCFLTTDAAVELNFLRSALQKAVDASFNMISIDSDTSTNDTVSIMANGMAGNKPIAQHSRLADAFQQALEQVCIYLAKSIAGDGEGATKLIEVTVRGAPSPAKARQVARTIVSSPLVKSAVHGNDPNWGRIMAAVGRSGVEIVESKIELFMGDTCVIRSGQPSNCSKQELIKILDNKEVKFTVDLNLGTAEVTAWGCDLSEEYVTINSQYTT
jgi:glutamate N-acetyltransferase/amino-acid N-acetyltransferase